MTRVLDAIEANQVAGGYMARCPAHEDNNPSLSISEGEQGRVLIHCHAGCTTNEVLARAGLVPTDLFNESVAPKVIGEWTPVGESAAVYSYVDEDDNLLFQVTRTADKQFRQRRPDISRKSGWLWKLGDVRRVLFRLPQIIEGVADGRVIYVVEGEKDVLALERAGQVATCNPGGAGKWRTEYSEALRDAHVVIVADMDEPGANHARQVSTFLNGIAATVTTVEPAIGKDAADHLGAGKSVTDFISITADTTISNLAPDLHEFLAIPDCYEWVVPWLIERGDRVIITGFEGWGKSTLLRQMAVCLAAGLHPFTHKVIEPATVLFIDCENSERQTRRQLRPLEMIARMAGHPVDEGRMRVLVRPRGLDLGNDTDSAWLVERAIAHKPDVLFIGPHYQLHNAQPGDEPANKRITGTLDDVRATVGCALVMEAHAGHGEREDRAIRPAGWSGWMRWPEFGYGLKPIKGKTDLRTKSPVALVEWRGPRDERDFPDMLERGRAGQWPWVGTYTNGIPSRSLAVVRDPMKASS